MINLADKLTAKTVEGILADSNEIKYTKEMGDTAKAETVAKELSNITDSMSGLSNSVTALSQEFETTQSDIEQLLNKAEQYTDRFVDNPIANSENSGLMSADDKKKADNYPERFVMDFGLVESQAVGEQMAAASEVAGNRNISFIRFQVQGVEALKTTLIMQWPNGINETAQIMCVDKAQWRRNVTGATGVEGAPTNAYPWECTAPHYIFYDAARRIIQLQNYEKKDVKSVELPLATSTQDGLLSAADKTKLENYPETPLNISTATDDSPGLMSEVAYKDLYDTKTLAAGNQTKITDLEAKINELGNFDTQHQLLARAAEFDIVSNNSIVFIHGTYKQAEGIYHGVFILQQVEMNNNGGGTSMQYIYIEKRQYTRYISFSPTEVTEVQQVQNHGVRNLSLSGRNLQMTDVWGYNVGIGVTFPDNGNIYEGTPSMSSVPVVLAKTFGGTVATTLSAATSTRAGMMSAADKTKLDKTKPVEEVTWTEQSHMNAYTECGEFHIKGERTNANDGLPILNAASGHTIDATLTVLDSSLSGGTGAKTDACVTQVLRMSNRTGGDGHIYVRTGQGVDKEQLDWGTWEKLMGMFEKNGIDTLEDLDGYTTNGMYSGLYAADAATHGGVQFSPGDTFLIVTVNGYAVGLLGNNQLNPQITQLLYKLPAKTLESEQNAEIYLRTGSYNKTDKVWVWGNFIKMATNADLSSQVATLTAKINQNAANITSATTAASEARTIAQEAQADASSAATAAIDAKEAADTATRMLRFSSIIYDANIEEQEDASISPDFLIVFVRVKGLFVASDGGKYYKVFTGSDDYNTTLDGVTKARQDRLFFIQSLDENRYYHYDGIDLRHLTTSEHKIAGRVWNEDNATPKAESYYGSLKALLDLPKRLGLGRYLVKDDRKKKKLDPKDSTKYLDGSPAKLDGSEGQCMWCWNGFYANIWHEGSHLIKAVTFDKPVGGETSVWIPAGGISWLGAGVMDRTNQKLCSLISDAEQYRGGSGAALNPTNHPKAPSAESPQITMLGMPATVLSATKFGTYARKRGEGWEANWFVARFVVEFLFEIIMGTENSQEAFNSNKDANGLYQGGFGTGVTDMPDWGKYNGTYPIIPTSVGLEAGDGVCLAPYSLPNTGGAEGAYHTFNVPVFFGLVGAGFGHLYQWTRGLIMDAGEEKSLVYVTPSMYADYDHAVVTDKILVAECPRVSGYIKRKSYQGLCCMPTEVGGSETIRFADYFHTNVDTSKGLRVRVAGGGSDYGSYEGASCTYTNDAAMDVRSNYSAPLCYFEEDPIIPESEKIEL